MALRPVQVRVAAADTAIMIPGAVMLRAGHSDLQLPVVIMAGRGHLIVHPENHAKAVAKVIEDVEMRVVPKQGHFFHYAVPGQVPAAVDDVSDRAG